MQLVDTAAELEAAESEPLRLLQAAKSLHAAMLAALTAALAGSSGTGAYTDKVRDRWLAFLESQRENVEEVHLPQRVLSSGDLLDRACTPGSIEWTSEPLSCSTEERELIDRLTFIRDEFEHPKPMLNCFEPPWVAVTFAPAVRITKQSLEAVAHHLDDPDAVEILTSSIIGGAGRWLP